MTVDSMSNPLLSVRIPANLNDAIEQRATKLGWTKSQVVIDLLASALAVGHMLDDGMVVQYPELGFLPERPALKDPTLEDLRAEFEDLRQQLAHCQVVVEKMTSMKLRLEALEASLDAFLP